MLGLGPTEVSVFEPVGIALQSQDLGVVNQSIDHCGSIMEIDGVSDDRSVFIEAFARIGPLKSGQRRKVCADALKLISLKACRPRARFILAFADAAAVDSLQAWQVAVLDQHEIERIVVTLPPALRNKLSATQKKQKEGMNDS